MLDRRVTKLGIKYTKSLISMSIMSYGGPQKFSKNHLTKVILGPTLLVTMERLYSEPASTVELYSHSGKWQLII